MVSGLTDFTKTTNYLDGRAILHATIPEGVYKDKEIKAFHDVIKSQVGDEYLVVVTPEDVKLEIISE